MEIGADAELLEPLAEGVRSTLAVILGDDDAADIQADCGKSVDLAENLLIVGDAEIATDLVFFDVAGIDDNDDLGLILELRQHPDLGIRLESRQPAGGMGIVKKFSAELKVKLPAEKTDPSRIFSTAFYNICRNRILFLLISHFSPSVCKKSWGNRRNFPPNG
jgi:hypothetical protein